MNINHQRLFKVSIEDGALLEIFNPIGEIINNRDSNSAFIGKSIVFNNEKYLVFRMPSIDSGNINNEIYDTYYDEEMNEYGYINSEEYKYAGL